MEPNNPPLTGGPAREHHKDTTDPQKSEIEGNVFSGFADGPQVQPDKEDRESDANQAGNRPNADQKENSPG